MVTKKCHARDFLDAAWAAATVVKIVKDKEGTINLANGQLHGDTNGFGASSTFCEQHDMIIYSRLHNLVVAPGDDVQLIFHLLSHIQNIHFDILWAANNYSARMKSAMGK
jgi:hypothetical protein